MLKVFAGSVRSLHHALVTIVNEMMSISDQSSELADYQVFEIFLTPSQTAVDFIAIPANWMLWDRNISYVFFLFCSFAADPIESL